MKARAFLGVFLAFLAAVNGVSMAAWVGAPETSPTRVDEDGVINEDWGTVRAVLEAPEEESAVVGQTVEYTPGPVVDTEISAGAVAMHQRVFRAPVWGGSVDVLEITVSNTVAGPSKARVTLEMPDTVSVGPDSASAGGRRVAALPQAFRTASPMRAWGSLGGVTVLPGWANPPASYDPAFSNIVVGMDGAPIGYMFSAPPGVRRTIVLGFCEGYHSVPGARPLMAQVEGAPPKEIDPVVLFGANIPGCTAFSGLDTDGDGYISVQVKAAANSPDKNAILNAIWVFEGPEIPDLDQVRHGVLNESAEHYVDVGGEDDQGIYEPGPVHYDVTVSPEESTELTFLFAATGAATPEPASMNWNRASLERAAGDIWRDWLAPSSGELLGDAFMEQRAALVKIGLSFQTQNGFSVILPGPTEFGRFSWRNASPALNTLEQAGMAQIAGRCLRALYSETTPDTFVALRQEESGHWNDQLNDPDAHAWALCALTRHLAEQAPDYVVRAALPALERGWAHAESEGVRDTMTDAGHGALEEAARYRDTLRARKIFEKR